MVKFIQNKIEEIRRKPERERLRYVWVAVAMSMFFMVLIWLFSIRDLFGEKEQIAPNSNSLMKITPSNGSGDNNKSDNK